MKLTIDKHSLKVLCGDNVRHHTSHHASVNIPCVIIRTFREPVGSRCLVFFAYFATFLLVIGRSVPVFALNTSLSQNDQDLIINLPETTSSLFIMTNILKNNQQLTGQMCL